MTFEHAASSRQPLQNTQWDCHFVKYLANCKIGGTTHAITQVENESFSKMLKSNPNDGETYARRWATKLVARYSANKKPNRYLFLSPF